MEKAEARRLIKEKIQRLTRKEIVEKSGLIAENLFSFEPFRDSRFAMFFLSMKDEVLTLPMIERAIKEGKRVCAPRVILPERRMILIEAELRNGKVPFRRGEYGIMEPNGDESIAAGEIDFVVVPGRAFDLKGNRLGRGAGYYDNFLKSLSEDVCLCGIAFECQILEEVPTDENDWPVDAVITEEKIYQF